MRDKLLESLFQALDAAKLERPDVPVDDLLAGPNAKPQSIDEFNASGEEMVFVCLPVMGSDFASDDIVPGSTMRKCEGCACDIWMSPATLGLSARITRKRILCQKCSMEAAKQATGQ